MPFTGSHPAAVLPFLGTPLPMSALVAGSIAPDAASYVPGALFGYPLSSHELSGVFRINLLVGLLLWAVWHVVVSRPALAAAPFGVRARCAHLPIGIRVRLRRPLDLVLVPAAVVLGALTHVLLDNFTHVWGWAIPRSALLRSEHLGVPGWTWAQVGLSALGLLVIGATLHRAWGKAPIAPIPPDRILLPTSAVLAWCVLAATAALGVIRGLYVAVVYHPPTNMVPWHLLTRSLGWAVVVGTVLALLWHVRQATSRLRGRGHAGLGSAPK